MADQTISVYEGVGRNLSYSYYIALKHKIGRWKEETLNAGSCTDTLLVRHGSSATLTAKQIIFAPTPRREFRTKHTSSGFEKVHMMYGKQAKANPMDSREGEASQSRWLTKRYLSMKESDANSHIHIILHASTSTRLADGRKRL